MIVFLFISIFHQGQLDVQDPWSIDVNPQLTAAEDITKTEEFKNFTPQLKNLDTTTDVRHHSKDIVN